MRAPFYVLGAFCLLSGTASPLAGAFNADGIVSGITRQQLALTVARLGIPFSNVGDGQVNIMLPGTPWREATLGFCGNLLTTYRRNITSDVDYANTLARVFSVYGPPKVMSFRGDVATDLASGSGAMQSYVVTDWIMGDERVRLKSTFDWRINQGKLGRFQPASLLYETRSPCSVP